MNILIYVLAASAPILICIIWDRVDRLRRVNTENARLVRMLRDTVSRLRYTEEQLSAREERLGNLMDELSCMSEYIDMGDTALEDSE